MRSVLMSLFLFLLLTGCKPKEEYSAIRKDLDSIIAYRIPDKREAVGNIDLEKQDKRFYILKGETDLPDLKDDITGYLIKNGINHTDNLVILPDSTVGDKKWGLVSVSVANVKEAPSHTSELISQAIMGTPVKILKRRGGWMMVQTPDYYIGWISDSGVSELDEAGMKSWKNSKRLIVTDVSGIIFSEDTSGATISDIVAGSIVVDSGGTQGIALVALPDGRKGRISRELTEGFETWYRSVKPDPEKLIRFARMFVGFPYLWGGTSTKAMDCSGFVKTVYFTGGIILARDASQQFIHGIKVDVSSPIEALQPGDLVFIGYVDREGIERIIHTGMYIGDTEVIHCSGMVRINSLDSTRSNYSSYLGRGLMGARRIIGADNGRGTEHVALNSWYTDIE